jgi:V/A-type H+-transporting ATPase subunit I
MEHELEHLSSGLAVNLEIDKKSIMEIQYDIKDALEDMKRIKELVGTRIDEINEKRAVISKYEQFKEEMDCIEYKDLELERIDELNYFDYEIGALSKENRVRLRKNYENISAVVLSIGNIKHSVEDLYIIIYPRWFREETSKLLKSLNWVNLDVPENINGTVLQMIKQTNEQIKTLNDEIYELSKVLITKKEEIRLLLNKIHTTVELEKRILGLEREVVYGTSSFVLNAWVKKNDKGKVERLLNSAANKIIIEEKNADELGRQVMPPTQFKNNIFFRPFEAVIKLYGLPSYYEIDPTPFLAITFCFMFGIMFGDIGQGLVYFVAGILLHKKSAVAGQILTRLGGSSIVFGFVYGSLFGLEQSELPWLPSLVGRPLDPKNIPIILITGVVFGVVVLTVSFSFGVINSLKRGNIEGGIFGKNGVAGYIFL